MASVFLGNITHGHLHLSTVQSLLKTKGTGVVEHIAFKAHGPYLDCARNAVIEAFLDEGQDWLVFFDSDISWEPQQILDLVESGDAEERPVVSGVYYSLFEEGEKRPVLYQWREEGNYRHLTQAELDEAPEDLVEVEACGAGFLAIHRDLLLKMQNEYPMPTPWFAEVPINGIQCGEDLTFCARVIKMGYRVFVNRKVVVGHVKQVML